MQVSLGLSLSGELPRTSAYTLRPQKSVEVGALFGGVGSCRGVMPGGGEQVTPSHSRKTNAADVQAWGLGQGVCEEAFPTAQERANVSLACPPPPALTEEGPPAPQTSFFPFLSQGPSVSSFLLSSLPPLTSVSLRALPTSIK